VNEAFRHQVIYPKETKFPVKQITPNSFLFVQESDLFVVGVTRQNADAAVIFEVLHTFIKTCKLYFGGDFDEESVRGNFLLVYEILDGTTSSRYSVRRKAWNAEPLGAETVFRILLQITSRAITLIIESDIVLTLQFELFCRDSRLGLPAIDGSRRAQVLHHSNWIYF